MRSFSECNVDEVFQGIDATPEGAKRYLRGTINQSFDQFDRSMKRWRLLPQEAHSLEAIVGRPSTYDCRLGSDLSLRMRLGSSLIDQLYAMQILFPQRRFFLVTTISDRWLSFDRHTQIWLGGMKGTIRQVLRLGGFAGWFGLIEVQTLDETVQGLGRLLLPHGHFIAWSDDPLFDPEAAESNMAASRRLESRTGAKTVDVRVDHTTSVCNMGAYIMKAAALAKRRVPSSSNVRPFDLGDCALPPVAALRQIELLSQVTFDELMLSGGGGGALRKELSAVSTNGTDLRL